MEKKQTISLSIFLSAPPPPTIPLSRSLSLLYETWLVRSDYTLVNVLL